MKRLFFPLKTYRTPCETGHGRIETRKLSVLPAQAANIGKGGAWKQWTSVAQILKLERTRQIKLRGAWQEKTITVDYFITSLCQEKATPKRLLALQRGHWAIENTLHRTKDVLLMEDWVTARKGNAPANRAITNNLTLFILSKIHTSPKIAQELCQNNRSIALNVVLN